MKIPTIRFFCTWEATQKITVDSVISAGDNLGNNLLEMLWEVWLS